MTGLLADGRSDLAGRRQYRLSKADGRAGASTSARTAAGPCLLGWRAAADEASATGGEIECRDDDGGGAAVVQGKPAFAHGYYC